MVLQGVLIFCAGIVVGILTAPKTGRGSRSWIRQRFEHWHAQSRDIGAVMRRKASYEEGKLAGAVHRIRQLTTVPNQGKYVDDDLITQRVRTHIGEDRSTGMLARINVDTADRIVTLRGGVASQRDKENLDRVVTAVQDVDDVVNKVKVISEHVAGDADEA